MSRSSGPEGAGGLGRRISRILHRRPRLRLAVLLTAPVAWLVVAYLGALVALLVTSFYSTDPFTTEVVHRLTFQNFRDLASIVVYRRVALRTIGIAAAVTLIDVAIALPTAFFIAKIASPRSRRLLVAGVVMPLWASYLVKSYAWRAMLDPVGGVFRKWIGASPGFGLHATVIVLAYLWLPYMVLPIYAGLERLPNSLLEASGDLGAQAGTTFRRVVLPLIVPAIVAGSIFTFSLSLGDYIAVGIVGGKTQMIGNVVYRNFGANNLPFASAFAVVPVVVMVGYLVAVRRSGALESL
ncbi:MAG: putative spermidine/putrescine transport system permease protein [Actinomycetota bacterium]|jgi:putative spermidine/putrescine transport system permease protein|nr:putative spermidine/putrescine transport system permease protein [Actinomycetota bacterium]